MVNRVSLPLPALTREGVGEAEISLIVNTTGDPDRASEAQADGGSGWAFRAIPLVGVYGDAPTRQIVIGQTWVDVSERILIDCGIQARWSEERGWRQTTDDLHEDELAQVAAHLASQLASGKGASYPADNQTLAAEIAKVVAETSRNTIADLRELRYELEHTLADHSRKDALGSPRDTLAALLELSIAASRARDQARAAVREGLWLWRTDPEAYHRYRRRIDPSIINEFDPADASTRPWMRLHDATVRQCAAIEEQLAQESAHLATLLDAATTLSSAREADSQEAFNVMAAVAALGLGLPALVLALYSANWLLPLNTDTRYEALIPVAVGALFAAGLAVWRVPWGHRGRTTGAIIVRSAAALIVVIILMGLLILAGQNADPTKQLKPGPASSSSP